MAFRSTSSSSSSTSSSSSVTTGHDRSTIRTSGGSVTVRRRDGALEVVEVTTVEGWRAEHASDDRQVLVVTFIRPHARIDVTIRLSATGVTSSVASVTTG